MNAATQRSAERAPDDDEDDGPENAGADEGGREAEAQAAAEREADEEQQRIEGRARKLGWVPEAEWRGKKGGWVPAEEFLDRALVNRPIMEERFRKIERDHEGELSAMQRKLDEADTRLREQGEVLNDIHSRFQRADKIAYERARADLKREMEEAVAEADTDKFKAAQQKLDNLVEPGAQEDDDAGDRAQPGGKGGGRRRRLANPVVTEWRRRNPWFDREPMLNGVAQSIHMELQRTQKGLSLEDNLDEVSRQIRQRFPEHFENDRRRAPSTTTAPSGDRQSGRRGRTYNDLPADAKAACDKFVRTIPGYKVQDYLDTYEWE